MKQTFNDILNYGSQIKMKALNMVVQLVMNLKT